MGPALVVFNAMCDKKVNITEDSWNDQALN